MPDKEEVIEFLKSYGIPEDVLRSYNYLFSSNRVYIYSGKILSDKRVVAGLPVCRFGRTLKPTTVGVQFFGKFITRKTVELDKENAEKFIKGYDLDLSADRGFVVLKYKKDVLGVGFSDGHKIRNNLPKQKRIQNISIK